MNRTDLNAHRHRSGRAMRPFAAALLVLCGWLLPGAGAQAQTCWISGSPSFSLGTVNAGGAASTSTLRVTCDNYSGAALTHRVCLYMNPSNPTGVAPRRMVNWNVTPNAFINFDLYSDPAYSQILGSESSNHPVYSIPVTLTANGQANASMPIYVRMPAGQTVAAGNYVSQIDSVIHSVSRSGTTAPAATQCAAAGAANRNYSEVQASYANGCYIAAASELDFGSATALANGNRDGNSSISLRCPQGTNWRVGLDNGLYPDGTQRRMSGPGGYITYDLYRDANRSQKWGSASGTTQGGTGNNATQTLTVHGRVPPQAVLAPGTYADTITVTLTY